MWVNWDRIRLDNGLGILRKVAELRQVFLFTCHDWLAERLADGAEVKVVTLG